MSWFKVDDSFYDHPKIESLPMAARGLWVTAGTWCAKQLTDGVISAKKVRAIGGTKAQIRALVESGLWVESIGDRGSIYYSFHDWFDMQPSRDQVRENRQNAQRRQAESRAKRRANRSGENATTGSDGEMSRCDTPRDITRDTPRDITRDSQGVSHDPDPTRPVTGGSTSQPSNGDHGGADAKIGGGNPLDALAAAARRARAAGASESAVDAGFREFSSRPEPKGPGLLRSLIDDAAVAEQANSLASARKAERRAIIDACPTCDDNGFVLVNGVAKKCSHSASSSPGDESGGEVVPF